jgi:chromatin segregation and condensation protein Rec8/ScpA/Scc1 (kleisin family)
MSKLDQATTPAERKIAKVEIVVSFLAMLEMVKQGVLHVTQHEDHGDIHMETREIDTPLYV